MLILALAVIAVERDGHDNSILTVCLLKDCLLIWYNFNRIDILNSNFSHKDQEAFLHIPDNIPEVIPITNRNATVDTKELVATIAYIIGVKKHIVEKCFDAECHDTLQMLYASQPATIIRYLCKLRTTLFLKYKKTDIEMRTNLKNLTSLEWYDHENIAQLEAWDVHIIKANYRSDKYMLDINALIAKHIDAAASLFPDWVEWSYIRELFVIPHYSNQVALKREFEKFMKSSLKYTIHQENKGGSYKNGIIGLLIAILSGALIDEAALKLIADAFSSNDLITSVVILFIIIALIVYGVFIKKDHDSTNYYEDVISIIDEAIDKIS